MRSQFVGVMFALFAVSANAQYSIQYTTTGPWQVALGSRGGFGRDTMGVGGQWGHLTTHSATYFHDGGLWFGCVRSSQPSQTLIEMTYSPHTRFSPGPAVTSFDPLLRGTQYERVYSSAEYNADGTPKTAGLPPWPIRNVQGGALRTNGNSGDYVRDSTARIAKPAAFLADQDLVIANGDSAYGPAPYPLGLHAVTTVYAWNNDSLRNALLVKTVVTNTSSDTFLQCFMAPVCGFAIGNDTTNDDCAPDIDDSLQMLIAHSEAETDTNLGAVGLAVINPPRAVKYAWGYAWADYLDPYGDGIRYQFLSQPGSSTATFATVRALGSCGPFTLKPNESAEIVYALIAGLDTANPSVFDSNRARVLKTLFAVRNYWFAFNTPSAVSEGVPGTQVLSAYPNPFSTATRVTLPAGFNTERAAGSLELVDALGRAVDRSVMTIGNGTVEISATSLPAGVYRLRMKTGSGMIVAPVVVTH